MSLCFLVEGEQTEKRVYRAWVAHTFPSLEWVASIGEMTARSYCVISGGGIPLYLKQIRDVLLDIKDHPVVSHLFICIDAEDLSYEERLAEIEGEVRRAETETSVRNDNPSLRIHSIVQNCCVETWFLGHTKRLRRNPSAPALASYKSFFDVSQRDPELMGAFPGFSNRVRFHRAYVQEMLQERNPNLRYSKSNPGIVKNKDYLDALRERTTTTGHLPSLQKLFDAWSTIASTPP